MGSYATHAFRDDQFYLGLKAVIDQEVHGVQSIWEANPNEEKRYFYLLTRRTCLMISIKLECCGWSVIYECLELVLFLTAIVTTNLFNRYH